MSRPRCARRARAIAQTYSGAANQATEAWVGRACGNVPRGANPELPHSVELTRPRYAAQLVNSTIGEREPGSRSEVPYRAGYQDLTWLCDSADAGGRMHRDAPDSRPVDLGLARVNPATQLESKSGRPPTNLLCTSDRSARSVEDGEQPVARSVDLLSLKGQELLLDLVEKCRQHVSPARVAELDSPLGRPHDIEKQDRQETTLT